MCRQIGFALRATTKRGGLPSGFAAGTARRRFDLKVELQAIRLPFDIPAPSTFVKRRRAIPTFGSRQAPRHECRLRGTRISTNGVTMPIALQSTCCSGNKPPDIRARTSAPNMPAWVMQRLLISRCTPRMVKCLQNAPFAGSVPTDSHGFCPHGFPRRGDPARLSR